LSLNSHLRVLEAEAIEIVREAVALGQHPVMLYSIGKDSSVLLHLARKAFWPAPLPFPLLHVDTKWKFSEMIRFRDRIAEETDLRMIVHTNWRREAEGVNPFTYSPDLYTALMKTEALKQALDEGDFDMVIGGARRDEEKSRSKERVSFRARGHVWDPRVQRPELWNLYNTRKCAGETFRVFPLSNWSEPDIWQYISEEQIPVVSLYFAALRPVVNRADRWILVDDDRFPLHTGETPQLRMVRFRTLGCYPLTAAIDSTAMTLTDIVKEITHTHTSERNGRLIDHQLASSMENKKRDGYF